MDSLIVFSHLRWNFVYQRPQHLMERLAKRYRVFFFEEPVYEAGSPRLVVSEPRKNVFVCTPRTPFDSTGFHDWIQSEEVEFRLSQKASVLARWCSFRLVTQFGQLIWSLNWHPILILITQFLVTQFSVGTGVVLRGVAVLDREGRLCFPQACGG